MGGIHKILHPLGNTSVLLQDIQVLSSCESIAEIVIICREQDLSEFQAVVSSADISVPVQLTVGGNTRQESVRNGFGAVSADCTYIAIHDGARPLIRKADIEKVIQEARNCGAASLGVPVKDTIKVVKHQIIAATPERATLFLTQTPQVFRRQLYADAMQLASEQGRDYTDDCQLVEALGSPVMMVTGSYDNIKLTTPEDFAVAEALLSYRQSEES